MKLATGSIAELERDLNLLEVDAKVSEKVARSVVEIRQYREFNRLCMNDPLLSEQKEDPRGSILQRIFKDTGAGSNISNFLIDEKDQKLLAQNPKIAKAELTSDQLRSAVSVALEEILPVDDISGIVLDCLDSEQSSQKQPGQ